MVAANVDVSVHAVYCERGSKVNGMLKWVVFVKTEGSKLKLGSSDGAFCTALTGITLVAISEIWLG